MSFRGCDIPGVCIGLLAVACGGSSTRNPMTVMDPSDGGAANAGIGGTGARPGTAGSTSSGGAATRDPVDDAVECGSGPLIKCSRHSECSSDEACLCRPGNEASCVPANCRSNADCPEGACLETITGVGCPATAFVVGLYCTTNKDTCDGNAPSSGTCASDQVCRYNLDEEAYVCHPRCAG